MILNFFIFGALLFLLIEDGGHIKEGQENEAERANVPSLITLSLF